MFFEVLKWREHCLYISEIYLWLKKPSLLRPTFPYFFEVLKWREHCLYMSEIYLWLKMPSLLIPSLPSTYDVRGWVTFFRSYFNLLILVLETSNMAHLKQKWMYYTSSILVKQFWTYSPKIGKIRNRISEISAVKVLKKVVIFNPA